MSGGPRHARRDDVTQVIAEAIDAFNRADPAARGPDSVADAVLAALEEHGLEIVWREPSDPA